MSVRTYATDEAFRVALEQRVMSKAKSQGHLDATRQRQLLLTDRFLSRIGAEMGDAVVAKGGVALALRNPQARATQDLDLHLVGSSVNVLERLQHVGRVKTEDRMQFEISTEPQDLGTIAGDGVIYDGYRFRVTAMLSGRTYGDRFGLDIVFGGRPPGHIDVIEGLELVTFAGIPRGRYYLYPRELHIAEKLHAYTMPRPRPNGRVKDLPDIALLAQTGPFEAKFLREAIEWTFAQRGTHGVPTALPPASETLWAKPYARLARINQLPWTTLEKAHAAASAFLNPLLSGHSGSWVPDDQSWI